MVFLGRKTKTVSWSVPLLVVFFSKGLKHLFTVVWALRFLPEVVYIINLNST